MTVNGNVETEVKAKIRKARYDLSLLMWTWKSRKISTKTKFIIFQSNVLSIYGAESYKTNKEP